ncbi:MAG: (Fe-S)-binding protein [Candidatus Marinimicrobia bacterium]|nr:(Fe-S)-binding protein [Candidatus Neomarinimicrobiota bacterium]
MSSCPTYLVLGKEADSPRGRLALMKAIEDDQLQGDNTGAFAHLDICLGCLACQTSCPSGVQYGHLLEATRGYQYVNDRQLFGLQKPLLKIIASPTYLRWLSRLARALQLIRLDRLLIRLPILPRPVRSQLAGLPKIPPQPFTRTAPSDFPSAAPDGQRRGRVALFTGCVMDHWYGTVHAATVRVLRWNGYDVVLPVDNHCCGALHSHAGDHDTADVLLKNSAKVFDQIEADAIIINSAGCGYQLAEKQWHCATGAPVIDICVWLAANLRHPPQTRLGQRITYDAPCHLFHGQGITREPLQLLDAACQNMLPAPEAEVCCGSAGIYSITQGHMSQQILDRKIDNIMSVEPRMLATANPGCHLQLQAGLRLRGANVDVRHVVEVLDLAYQQDDSYRRTFGIV